MRFSFLGKYYDLNFLWMRIMFEIPLDNWDSPHVNLLEHEADQLLLSSAELTF